MSRLRIERRGGFANLPASGEIDEELLTPADRKSVDELFAHKGRLPAAQGADRFSYRITREGAEGSKTIEVPEDRLPNALRGAVRDRLP
ncbi:MAG: protealysin inhibitor emfourin [Alphaproteobacteria bacterium]